MSLRTIVLDPEAKARTPDERTELLGTFLTTLAASTSRDGRIPGTETRMFASSGLIATIKRDVKQVAENEYFGFGLTMTTLDQLARREVPPALKGDAFELLSEISRSDVPQWLSFQARTLPTLIEWGIRTWGPTASVTVLAARALMSSSSRRQLLENGGVDWPQIWSAEIPAEDAHALLRIADRELAGHRAGRFLDDDVAYGLDLAVRIREGLTEDPAQRTAAAELIDQAAELYPAVHDYQPGDGPPNPNRILEQIAARRPEGAEEDIPF